MPPGRPLLDLRINGYEPADEAEADLFSSQIELSEPELTVLVSHHDDTHSYLAFHDGSMTWDVPGSPQYLAVHVTRDPSSRTFRYVSERLPLLPLAQQWLVVNGCPEAEAETAPDLPGAAPVDHTTTALEAKLRTSPGRYELLDHYTDDTAASPETTVLLRDTHPDAAETPYRVLVETVDPDGAHYRLSERCFPTAEAADDWLENRVSPVPGSE